MDDFSSPTPERSLLEKIFLCNDERRLRAFWRLLLHTILLIVIGLAGAMILAAVFMPFMLMGIKIDSGIAILASQLITFLALTTATFVARKFFDRRSIVSLGLKLNRRTLYDLLSGIIITFFMMGLIYLIELLLGWTKFESFSWQTESAATIGSGLFIWLVIFLITGWQEELLSRGYHLQNIADGLNLFWGVLISSSIFGILHINNPSASWISTLGIILAGFFLALPYLLTRQLWLSIGLHIGWNFFEGVVFGFPVSGLTTYRILRHTVSGPEIWTGGAFGPEAGLLLIPALVLGALLVYGYTRLQSQPAISESS
jgi:membrane protease YdiL (CAAX protease family)